ncbi:MAG: peptidoglycan editing factor PgeF [Holosporaceae bacterium]|jgi:YfiH family protein|nr:peptidoglycan editing factor PgeF [Holosporaceae bacterium]
MMVTSQGLVVDGVAHGFFGREFGKSSGLFASLNGSRFVGDDALCVQQNLDIVKRELNARRLVTLKQMHNNICIIVDSGTESDVEADAMITKATDIAICVLTADCAPVLLLDEENKIAGAIHAGWKGLVSGVVESTVNKMSGLCGEPPKIKAAIGPCIQKISYEVSEDFQQNFIKAGEYFLKINSKKHFDLPGYCKHKLLRAGLIDDNIEILDIDTYADPKNYFSYRYAGQNTGGICGRNISAICLRQQQ